MSLATKTYQNSYSTNIGQLLLPMLGQRNCCLSHPDSGESALQTLVFSQASLGQEESLQKWQSLDSFCLTSASSDALAFRCKNGLTQMYRERFWRENWISQGRVSGLNGEVPQKEWVGLDTVTLLIIVGGIKQFPWEIGPLTSNSLSIQLPDVDWELLKHQDPCSVNTLEMQGGKVNKHIAKLHTTEYAQELINFWIKNCPFS